MRPLLIIFFLFVLTDVVGQRWTKIPGGNIEFSNFTDSTRDNWFTVDFEYFRKYKNVIGVPRGLTEEFYAMIQATPVAFDSIFNNLRQRTTKPLESWRHYDSSLEKIDFFEAAIIEGWTVVQGYNEVIWILANNSWSRQQTRPCYTHVVFADKKNSNKLYFLSAFFEGCEF